MARSRPRWPAIALGVAVLAGLILGSLSWWRSRTLAEDHAARAQKAMDEMSSHYANLRLLTGAIKTARRPADRARYEAMMRSSRHRLARLAEAADRHERLARDHGYKAPFRRPEPDPGP